ncbi:group II truncated hemoglobin [Acidithiobacillus sp. AMEEHan]|uniref:group II truncated hemoglobin n=1 Tax=Acidithiobacillus sp. AMEEHan TaxID=2994951 RepID=UPI0027E486F9|nr:group II truncated hemoglobin [Acidithiobacillus sp. AMEEHan]
MSVNLEPSQSPYQLLGGEAALRKLVNCFYDLMDSDAQWHTPLRVMHPEDLSESKEKLFLFLSGWLGGPDLYVQKFGHPRLRARHASFPVNNQARDQWMECMLEAMKRQAIAPEVHEHLQTALQRTADAMRNC